MPAWKKLLIAVLIVTMISGTTVVLAGAYVTARVVHGVNTGDFGEFGFGSMRVAVHDRSEGVRFGLRLPAALVNATVSFAPGEFPAEAAAKLRRQLPLLAALSKEIRRCPDAVFVEVSTSRSAVKVEKRGDLLLIRVDEPDAEVRLDIPLECVQTVVRRLETATRG